MPHSRKTLERLLFVASAVFLLAAKPLHSAPEERPPNLVVIMTDDQGYGDVGFNGSRDIVTPHIDSIAANGVRFSSGYVSYSVCSPSRAGFLTGRYQQRFGYERNPRWEPDNPGSGLPLSETTLADALGEVGYTSGIIGKWHLGAHRDLHPLARGFDEFFGHLGGGHRYFPEELTFKETKDAKNEHQSYRLWIMRDHSPVKTTGYLTDEFSDEAVRFVERNQKDPFFLFLSYNAPHAPLQATEKYLARFPEITNERRRAYAAMVSAVDDGVGQLLGKLRELGLEENTLIFFLSDNGGPTKSNASNNDPLRGTKGDLFEGGIRVPFAAQWPGRLPAGGVFTAPVISLDIFATIAALAGVAADPARPLDGVNLMPHLEGQATAVPHDTLYWRMFDNGAYAVRNGDRKLVIPEKGQSAKLFNLAEDIGEQNDLAPNEIEELDKLNEKRAAWEAELIEPVFDGLLTPRR